MKHWLLQRLAGFKDQSALVLKGRSTTYEDLLGLVNDWLGEFSTRGLSPGSTVLLDADYSPASVAFILASVEHRLIVVPLRPTTPADVAFATDVASATECATIRDNTTTWESRVPGAPPHNLIQSLRERMAPGLIVFTSGSSGVPKAILHDLDLVLHKFRSGTRPSTTLIFLMFDHLGGLNTLFGTLAAGGVAVLCESRQPDDVAKLIQTERVQLLPTSPTFLRLFLMAECHRRFDCSSLQLVTYGTEAMPRSMN